MGSRYTHVFSPITIRGNTYKNRIEMAPTSPKLTDDKGYVTTELVNYFRAPARGGAAVVNLGNCTIDIEHCQDEARQVALDNDDYLTGLSRLADMFEEYDCFGSIEINHIGADTVYEYNGCIPEGASAMVIPRERIRAEQLGREPICCREMSVETIRGIVKAFGEAAARCKLAGFRHLLVHGGHGCLLGQFASPLYNRRTDEYGGSTEKRARLAIEVLDAVRAAVGEDVVLEYRVSADEIAPGGMHFEETKRFLKLIEDKVDIVNVSAGLHCDPAYFRYWSPSMYMGSMINVPYAAELKKILKCRISTVAGIDDLENAERILAEGKADFVMLARPFMADPDMPRKYAADHPEEHRHCTRCGYCSRRIVTIHTVACAVNPKLGRETELNEGVLPPAPVKKRVVVVGAGPAGMQATLTLLERGHDVVVFERAPEVGGNLAAAAGLHVKTGMRKYLEYMIRQMHGCGADLRLNTAATPELVAAEKPDAIIVATGAEPLTPDIPGIGLPNVHWGPDAMLGRCECGERVVMIGGGVTAMETAWELRSRGKEVTVLEPESEEAMDARRGYGEIHALCAEAGVELRYARRCLRVEEGQVVAQSLGTGEEERYPCDTVLTAIGREPDRAAIDAFRHLIPETEVRIVGDARRVAYIGEAVHAGFDAALHV